MESSWKMDMRITGKMIRFMLGRPLEAVEGEDLLIDRALC